MTIQTGKAPAATVAPAPAPAPAPKRAGGLRAPGAYRVLDKRAFIEYPDDDDQLAALVKGDKIPRADRKVKRVHSGEIATGIPAASIKALVASGWVCEANGPDDPYRKAPAPVAAPDKGEGE